MTQKINFTKNGKKILRDHLLTSLILITGLVISILMKNILPFLFFAFAEITLNLNRIFWELKHGTKEQKNDKMVNIEFKSDPKLYRKEFLGLKSNTVRDIKIPDVRQEILMDYNRGKFTNLTITIVNKETSEQFTREVTDVTFFNNLWIISWSSSIR